MFSDSTHDCESSMVRSGTIYSIPSQMDLFGTGDLVEGLVSEYLSLFYAT